MTGDDAATSNQQSRATVRTTHDRPAVVAAAVRPDNTPEIETRVVDGAVETTVERTTASELRATVDDYVVNLTVADQVARQATDDTDDTDDIDYTDNTDVTDHTAHTDNTDHDDTSKDRNDGHVGTDGTDAGGANHAAQANDTDYRTNGTTES